MNYFTILVATFWCFHLKQTVLYQRVVTISGFNQSQDLRFLKFEARQRKALDNNYFKEVIFLFEMCTKLLIEMRVWEF